MRRRTEPWKCRVTWACLVLCLLIAGGALGESSYTPIYPEASGEKKLGDKTVTVDISHIDLGYFMVKHSGSSKRLKVTTTISGEERRYNLNGDGLYETYPFTQGDGKYKVAVYEDAGKGDGTYARLFNESVKVSMPDPNTVFLAANQFVWFEPTNEAVKKSMELCAGLTNDYEKLNVLYDYVSTTIRYDYVKAIMVQTNKSYLPVVDDTLASGTGICFDYAALLACMLRVQGIPTQLVIGKLMATTPPGGGHAWNKVYINGTWLFVDATFRDQGYKQSAYIEERSY